MYKGVFTALITPFTGNGTLDEKCLADLVEMQIEGGVSGLVPVGTTGESPTLNHMETLRVLEIVVEKAAGRVPVIAGTGSNDTAKAITLTKEAREIGVNGTLQVTPYYNKPTQEGLYRHFSSIAEATELPMVLYNIPGRSGIPIDVSTLKRLAGIDTVAAVKEASGSIPGIMAEIEELGNRLDILSGDDNLTYPIMTLGGTGVISVASNIFPKPLVTLTDLLLAGKMEEARTLHYELLPLFRMVFLETNPIPIKAAMASLGLIEEMYRLPVCPPSEENSRKIREIVQGYKKTS